MTELLCLVHTYMRGSQKGMPIKSASAYPNKKCRCENCLAYKKIESRDYYDRNTDKVLQRSRAWYKDNKEYHNELTRNNYKQNKEKILEKHKEWKKNNKERYAQISSDWKKNNRHKIRLQNHRRKARKLNNGHEPYTEEQVLYLYGNNCHLCNSPIDLNAPRKCGVPGWENGLHLEHVIDMALGGPDTLDNVRPSHALCNLKKKPREMV